MQLIYALKYTKTSENLNTISHEQSCFRVKLALACSQRHRSETKGEGSGLRTRNLTNDAQPSHRCTISFVKTASIFDPRSASKLCMSEQPPQTDLFILNAQEFLPHGSICLRQAAEAAAASALLKLTEMQEMTACRRYE